MHPIVILAAAVAALVHVWFFAMESLWFMRPSVHGRFGLASEDQARLVRSWAYNQGFYNLFLAVGVVLAFVFVFTGDVAGGRAVLLFACGSMVAAGVVLVAHDRRFLRAGMIQAVPPLVAVGALVALG